jgi:hypothetical protein
VIKFHLPVNYKILKEGEMKKVGEVERVYIGWLKVR